MNHFAKPGMAIAFGAFFLCAETCLHADSVLNFARRPLELPVYDWTAGGFLLVAGVLRRRDRTVVRRQYPAVAWAFMLSLLVSASFEMLGEWGGPPDQNDWLSEKAFFAIVLTMTAIAACGLVSTLNASSSLSPRARPSSIQLGQPCAKAKGAKQQRFGRPVHNDAPTAGRRRFPRRAVCETEVPPRTSSIFLVDFFTLFHFGDRASGRAVAAAVIVWRCARDRLGHGRGGGARHKHPDTRSNRIGCREAPDADRCAGRRRMRPKSRVAMLKQSKGWIVSAVLIVVTTLPVCVLAQDTTVRDTESDGRQRKLAQQRQGRARQRRHSTHRGQHRT